MGRLYRRQLQNGDGNVDSATLVDTLGLRWWSRERPKQQRREEGTRKPSGTPGLDCDASAQIQEAFFCPRGLEGGKLLGRCETYRRSSLGLRVPAAGQAGPRDPCAEAIARSQEIQVSDGPQEGISDQINESYLVTGQSLGLAGRKGQTDGHLSPGPAYLRRPQEEVTCARRHSLRFPPQIQPCMQELIPQRASCLVSV